MALISIREKLYNDMMTLKAAGSHKQAEYDKAVERYNDYCIKEEVGEVPNGLEADIKSEEELEDEEY
jgi:hypothetical protein